MSCPPFDLKDYFLGELPEHDRRQVDQHLGACGGCREEVERLRLTATALRALPDEEIPQRIAFVSDKVFEPSPARRWWQAFWGSSARLGFASAAMLSAALVVFALYRPAPAPVPAGTPQVDTARLEQQFSQRLNEAVAQAVAASEARQAQKTSELLAAADKRNEIEKNAILLAVEQKFDVMRKQYNHLIIASNDLAGELGAGK